MRNIIKKPIIYMSHAILGSNKDIKGNCEKAIKAVQRLRSVFPEIYWYCPAEHNWVINNLYENEGVTIEQILNADLEILRQTDGWFFYKFDESSGSKIEMDEAIRLGFCGEHKTIFIMDIEKSSYTYLRKAFGPVVESAKRRFRGKK